LASIGCSAWNLALIWAGYLLGANWRAIDRILGQYSRVLLGAGIVLVAVWFLRRKILSPRAPR
jgi:membrane protein DedA with SNARE-associated domain